MAKIQINDTWRIQSDSYQWMLQKKGSIIKGKGEHQWVSETFHHSIEGALKDYVERRVRLSDAEGIAEIAKETDRRLSELTQALTPHYEITLRRK